MSRETRMSEALRRRDTLEDLLEEVSEYVEMSPGERDRTMQRVAELAASVLRDRGDREDVLAWQDPLPESSLRIWRLLMERYRRERQPA